MEQVYQGHYEMAITSARELRADFPGHPLPSIIIAEAYYELIYCETGHITSQEIWNVAERKASSYDDRFFEAIEESLASSRKMRQKPETVALGALYAGLARGIQARLFTFRGEKINAASEGKQMRTDFLEAVARNPSLALEAGLGLGAYNYYADILSPLLKVIRFFLGIPGGDREKGLEQLRTASEHASFVAAEAQYELARIYGLYEKRHTEAFQMLQKLSEQYPENALYLLSTAYQADLIGRKDIAAEEVRKAMNAAKTMDGVCRQRLGKVGQEALKRLQ
ncbi:MAG: hypothetical protein HY313_06490 [Acidobacteria bacterium]|nr:hypothetical protein [Acidobacteriota bacterium]